MIAGYCWPQSVRAGETVTVFCHSNAPRLHALVERQGPEAVEVAARELAGQIQELPDDLCVRGCDWRPSFEVTVDSAWPTGMYLVRFSTSEGESAEAFFVVRSPAPRDALLVLATASWSAYNHWGGPSLYTGQNISATRRPLPAGFLERPDPKRVRAAAGIDLTPEQIEEWSQMDLSGWTGAAGWAGWEQLFANWAERQGLELDYAISQDLDRNPDLLGGYPAYISVGHDEYWSAGMRDAVEGYIDAGGNAAFFSGNTSWWQVRFESDYGQVVGYKHEFEKDPVYGTDQQRSLSTMWSDPLVGRPENHMTGVSFTRGGYAHMAHSPRGSGGYTVWRPEHWAFDGVELRAGDLLGAEPVVVGFECDGCELELRDGLPYATGRDGTPEDFTVLATAPAHLWEQHELTPGVGDAYVGDLNWVAQRLGGEDTPEMRASFAMGAAVMGSFRRGRGEVFTTGCTDWAYGLDDPAVDRVTRNVLSRFIGKEL